MIREIFFSIQALFDSKSILVCFLFFDSVSQKSVSLVISALPRTFLQLRHNLHLIFRLGDQALHGPQLADLNYILVSLLYNMFDRYSYRLDKVTCCLRTTVHVYWCRQTAKTVAFKCKSEWAVKLSAADLLHGSRVNVILGFLKMIGIFKSFCHGFVRHIFSIYLWKYFRAVSSRLFKLNIRVWK